MEKEIATHSNILAWKSHGQRSLFRQDLAIEREYKYKRKSMGMIRRPTSLSRSCFAGV